MLEEFSNKDESEPLGKTFVSFESLHFFLIDTNTNNGSSGSPLFSLETGKVIGIVSGKITSRIPIQDGKIIDIPANIGLCRPIKYAIDLINKNN